MEDAKRIRPVSWFVHIAIPVFGLGIVFILIGTILGELTFRLVLACLLSAAAAIELITLVRTRNPVYLIPLMFYSADALVFFLPHGTSPILTIPLVGLALLFFILSMAALFTRRLKWRYREVLELAARSVSESADGFTARPFPAGKSDYTKEDLYRFSRFLRKYVIAYPFFEEDRVVWVVPENMFYYLTGLRRDYRRSTHIALDFEGNITVQITEKDYKKYTDELTFDQLCSSFGHLFVEFLTLYKRGDEKQIIQRMNALRFVV